MTTTTPASAPIVRETAIRRDLKAPIAMDVFALVALVLAFLAPRSGDSTFGLSTAADFFQIPQLVFPATAVVIVIAVLLVALAVVAHLYSARGRTGKVPLWLEDGTPEIGAETESTVGAMIVAGARRLAYVPGCARVTDGLKDRLSGVDALLFDGTVLADDDMIRAGVGTKTGWRMGHVPMTGDGGSVAALAEVPIGQKVFVHINNTNPVLVEDSPERRGIEAAGWVVAHDGLALSL